VPLDAITPVEKFKFVLEYDIGDSWEFKITFEKVLKDYDGNTPWVLKGKGNGIVEDCGGVWGLQELAESGELEDFDLDSLNEEFE
jgi:hypothetical protein